MKKFGRIAFFLAAVLGVCTIIGVAGAQVYPQLFSFVDVKSNGTRLHFFGNNGPKAHYINFKGGATINSATSALDVGGTYATVTFTPSPTPTPSPSTTCTPEGAYYVFAGSPTQPSTSFMCCQDGSNHLFWKRGVCQ